MLFWPRSSLSFNAVHCCVWSLVSLPTASATHTHRCEGYICDSYPPGLFPDFDCNDATSIIGGINWSDWRHIFDTVSTKDWTDHSGSYIEAYLDADETMQARHMARCPLGVLNANMFLYVVYHYQGDVDTASRFAAAIREAIAQTPLRILVGSRWPLFAMFTSDRLRHIPFGHSIFQDPASNCELITEPALHWPTFLRQFDAEVREDWFEASIRFVYSWQVSAIPDALLEECPLGALTAIIIRAFSCMTSESTCYLEHARRVELWLRTEPLSVELIAHSRWPLAMMLNHMARASRHKYFLDFTEEELVATRATLEAASPSAAAVHWREGTREAAPRPPSHWSSLGPWTTAFAGPTRSQSFRDVIASLPRLGPGPREAPNIVYVSMVFGSRFNKHIKRFCSRARSLGFVGERLILFALDDDAFQQCLAENGMRCVRGTPSIVNKFTLPLVLNHLGLDVVWLDLDVFILKDPTPAIVAHAEQGPFDLLVSGSFESDCICNGIVYFRAIDSVRAWLLSVVMWMYHHPYEHDQKTFSAFLRYTETVQRDPLELPEIPRWDTLDPINQFVTPDTFEGNGWTGDLDKIVLYHFLNGESDIGSDLDPSGSWMRDHGNFEAGNVAPPSRKDLRRGVSKTSLMDLFYSQEDAIYTSSQAPYENAVIRKLLLASRKNTRRTDLLGKPCGPMIEVLGQSIDGSFGMRLDETAEAELLMTARAGTLLAYGPSS